MSDTETRSLERRLKAEGRIGMVVLDYLNSLSDDDFKETIQQVMKERDRLLTVYVRDGGDSAHQVPIKDLTNDQVVEALRARFPISNSLPPKESTLLKRSYSASGSLKRASGVSNTLVLEGYRRGLIVDQLIVQGVLEGYRRGLMCRGTELGQHQNEEKLK